MFFQLIIIGITVILVAVVAHGILLAQETIPGVNEPHRYVSDGKEWKR